MRKWIINQDPQNVSPVDQSWLDLQRLAQVELTSEDAIYPIEAALIRDAGLGWRAAQAGEQTIRLLFDELQRIKHIQLLFHEDHQARTQEFVLRWSPDGGQSYRETLRQQYTFSPPGMTRECEEYAGDLAGVTALELRIVLDITQRLSEKPNAMGWNVRVGSSSASKTQHILTLGCDPLK